MNLRLILLHVTHWIVGMVIAWGGLLAILMNPPREYYFAMACALALLFAARWVLLRNPRPRRPVVYLETTAGMGDDHFRRQFLKAKPEVQHRRRRTDQ